VAQLPSLNGQHLLPVGVVIELGIDLGGLRRGMAKLLLGQVQAAVRVVHQPGAHRVPELVDGVAIRQLVPLVLESPIGKWLPGGRSLLRAEQRAGLVAGFLQVFAEQLVSAINRVDVHRPVSSALAANHQPVVIPHRLEVFHGQTEDLLDPAARVGGEQNYHLVPQGESLRFDHYLDGFGLVGWSSPPLETLEERHTGWGICYAWQIVSLYFVKKG
jgi:hypothetical protein